jgi:CrcB protein
MSLVLGVAAGGALGALSRYGVDTFVERRSDSLFPWSTFAINVSGCLAVGFLIAALVDRHRAPQWLRTALVMGFCGGYTTFSTFSYETAMLMEDGQYERAATYAVASVLVALVATACGFLLARELISFRARI